MHAFSMHWMMDHHETTMAENSDWGCGAMKKTNSESDKDCLIRCLDTAQIDTNYNSIEEKCYSVSFDSIFKEDPQWFQPWEPLIFFEDVWWIANEYISTLLHTHVTSIRMLD